MKFGSIQICCYPYFAGLFTFIEINIYFLAYGNFSINVYIPLFILLLFISNQIYRKVAIFLTEKRFMEAYAITLKQILTEGHKLWLICKAPPYFSGSGFFIWFFSFLFSCFNILNFFQEIRYSSFVLSKQYFSCFPHYF